MKDVESGNNEDNGMISFRQACEVLARRVNDPEYPNVGCVFLTGFPNFSGKTARDIYELMASCGMDEQRTLRKAIERQLYNGEKIDPRSCCGNGTVAFHAVM